MGRFATPSDEEAFVAREGLDGPSLIEWMTMTQEAFSALRGLAHQADQAPRPAAQRGRRAGNWGASDAVPALAVALNDEEPLVRGRAAWALGRIGTEAARQALSGRAEAEDDACVREEIAAALRSG
ncbi:HEAT repeat domain-containing protein [Longimicrobium sp.]|uniref:HEAT repeat domain-containing protein n=1 Tax=Longimicrobium sp. TaxID=2029185 RepID=UPI002E36B660|nr:HEAT repeat domain-containing protein [Longimicrobium sp.]HEX6042034.1 HEAT repeat domain-containing protein [Longimicrobium sp.]